MAYIKKILANGLSTTKRAPIMRLDFSGFINYIHVYEKGRLCSDYTDVQADLSLSCSELPIRYL